MATIMPISQPLADLQCSLDRVEAVRAIKALQHTHSHYALAGRWDDCAGLFAQKGRLVRGNVTICGPAAIAKHLTEEIGTIEKGRLFAELLMSPVVTLSADGRSGKGRWHEMTIDAVAGHHAEWAGGIHENDYILENGRWKIACLHYHPQFAGPFKSGWHGLTDDPKLVPYHFAADDVGRPVSSLIDSIAPDATDADVALLAARVQVLDDESAIIRVQNAWGYYVDRRRWDDVAELYADDGRIFSCDGDLKGRDAIRKGLEAMAPAGLGDGELNDHLLFAPVVTLSRDGATASARGIVLGMIGQHQVDAYWTLAVYDNDYVKQDGRWKLSVSRFYPRAATDYYQGWATSQIITSPGWSLAANSPADRFPAAQLPTIRFPHPVTAAPDKKGAAVEILMERDQIAKRISCAAAQDAVENIACAYGYYIDEFCWQDVATIFATGGWKELSYIGTYVGRDRVLGSLVARYGDKGRTSSFLAIHQKMQPIITIAQDGLSARMHLRLFQVGSYPVGPGPFIGGVYEDEAVLEDGVWKLSGMDLDYIWFAGYAEGWGKVDPAIARQFAPKPGAMDHYPPDGPLRGPAFAPFPHHEPLPFHFSNPVSGRKPPLRID